jgi:hypothetical protein
VLGRTCDRGTSRQLLTGIVFLAPLIAAKAVGVRVAGLFTIGAYDRLQTASLPGVRLSELRVVVLGGDTLLVVCAPAALLALSRARSWLERSVLLVCLAAALGTLAISATRTGLLVGITLTAGVGVALLIRDMLREVRPGRIALVGLCAALALAAFVGVSARTGALDRFTTADTPHVGLNFREDELRAFFRLPTGDILTGQGYGGRFTGKDPNGRPVVTGWSHAFPAWIALKAGIVGVIAALTLLVVAARRAVTRLSRGGDAGVLAELGVVIVLGVLLISLTLGRAALPEGAILLGVAASLISPRDPRPSQ